MLVVGSGNVVHNLGLVDFAAGATGEAWAHRFDDAVRDALTTDPEQVLAMERHHDFDLAAPTPDHYIPMLYLAGMAAAAGEPADVLVDGYFGGSLSMTVVHGRRSTPRSTQQPGTPTARPSRRCPTCPPTRPTCSRCPRCSSPISTCTTRSSATARACCSSTAPARRSRPPGR